ncbi:MAG: SDR family oxidoreductase [Bacteroidota bacterium]
MSKITTSVVLITGGASGIGKLMAVECAQRKPSLIVILDINAGEGNRVCEELNSRGCNSRFLHADLSNTDSITKVIEWLDQESISIDVLINNAGIVRGSLFTEHSADDILQTVAVNLTGPMLLTRELVKRMLVHRKGHIVNIASSAGMAAHPKLSAYVASKWGMIGWSESMRLELEGAQSGIRVTTVTPYYIDTGMFNGVHSPIIPLLKPDRVARAIIRGIEKNKTFVRMPWLVYAMPFFKGILPQRWFDVVVGKLFRVYRAMDGFTPPPPPPQ